MYCSLGQASQLFHTVRMDRSGCPSSVTLTVVIKNFRPRNFELTFTPGHFVINCQKRQKWKKRQPLKICQTLHCCHTYPGTVIWVKMIYFGSRFQRLPSMAS